MKPYTQKQEVKNMEYNEELDMKNKREERIANTDLSGAILMYNDDRIVNLDACAAAWLNRIKARCDELLKEMVE
jgi:hypothetical protein